MGLSEDRHNQRVHSKQNEVFYLKSIQRTLESLWVAFTMEDPSDAPSIATDVLADNRDWLDCYINIQENKLEGLLNK